MGLLPRSSSQPQLHQSMKIRRSSSVNLRRPGSYSAYGAPSSSPSYARIKIISFYLIVFASGCCMTAWLLSLSPQSQLERSTGSRLTVLVKPGHSVSRRSLYTAGSGGE
jgi:hypothetical protein